MLNDKKIKEIKQYAKDDVKRWVREFKREKTEEEKERFENEYPEGITSYYKKIVFSAEAEKERLIKQFGYTEETLKERAQIYHEAFWSSWRWWQNKLVEIDRVMAKYKPIFEEAEEVARNVDVSDIVDGFPCGMAVLYLKPEAKNTDLGKALRLLSDCDCYSAKTCHWAAYELPIKIPRYGQCMSFDERICNEVAEFLEQKGIPTGVYSMID
ncbi:MAG: hypothetical protein KBH94_06140 [Caldisericia bacterium]|nr:hypothetical protein [Caldisericia bacterium]